MSQHTGSHKISLNLFGEKYLNESHWPMRQIRLLECIFPDQPGKFQAIGHPSSSIMMKFKETFSPPESSLAV